MILDRTELYGGLQYAKNFKHLIEMRDSMEANSLKKCLTEVVPKMESKSKLFDVSQFGRKNNLHNNKINFSISRKHLERFAKIIMKKNIIGF